MPLTRRNEGNYMELSKILSTVDHTLLSQGATWEEIRGVCDDGIKYAAASVCIPASYVRQAREYVGDKLAVCTVIGFPNGYSTTAAKCLAQLRQLMAAHTPPPPPSALRPGTLWTTGRTRSTWSSTSAG